MIDSVPRYINKGSYVHSLKCDYKLWYGMYDSEIEDLDPHGIFRKQESQLVRNLAYQLFPEGKQLPYGSDHFQNHNLTISELNQGADCTILGGILFIPPFFARIDVLQMANQKIRLVEIKTSPKWKEDYFSSAYFLQKVFFLSGFEIQEIEFLYIKGDFQKQGEIDPHQFFQSRVISKQDWNQKLSLEQEWNHTNSILNCSDIPESGFSKKCYSPKSCQFPDQCWKELGKGDVFYLRDANPIAQELYQKKIYSLISIPEDTELTPKQKIQVQAHKTNKAFLSLPSIREFLKKLEPPIVFLDFETINPIVPIFENSYPFQHIPLQYSVHILPNLDSEEFELLHFDYIHTSLEDPRLPILESLQKILPETGSILAYNDYLEKRVLMESSQTYTDYQDWIQKLSSRFVDMAEPFRNFYLYHPNQNGYCGLKDVLQPFTGFSHDHLNIHDGLTANLKLLGILRKNSGTEEMEKTLSELKEYCRMDTYALYLLYNYLKKIST